MKKILSVFALTALASGCSATSDAISASTGFANSKGDISDVFGPATNPNRIGANARNPRPPETYNNQWYTTADGCSYSRAKAPGYPASWHLILNPHHIGQPNAHAGCPVQL